MVGENPLPPFRLFLLEKVRKSKRKKNLDLFEKSLGFFKKSKALFSRGLVFFFEHKILFIHKN